MGNSQVKWIVTDGAGNESVCYQQVSVANDLQINATVLTNTQCNVQPGIGSVQIIAEEAGTVAINGITHQVTAPLFTTEFTSLNAGYYTATFTSTLTGCTAETSFSIINENSNMTASLSVTQPLCNGETGAVLVEATGGVLPYTYILNGTSTNQTGVFNNLPVGTYNVLVTDANDCNYYLAFDIDQPTQLIAEIQGTNVLCNGGSDGTASVNVTGGVTPYTYLWNNTANTASVSGLTYGTYYVTITDANGCSIVKDITLTQPTAPLSINSSLTEITNLTCNGSSNGAIDITVVGGTAPYQYVWSNGLATQDIDHLAAGTYGVTITDANGCQMISSPYVVTQPSPISISVTNLVNTECNASIGSVKLTASTSGSFVVNNIILITDLNNSVTYTGLSAGYYQATFIADDGCSATSSFNIYNENSDLAATVTVADPLCNGTLVNATIQTTGGTAPYTYNLNGISSNQTGLFNNLEPGIYNVLVTDANGCTYYLSFDIDEPTPLVAGFICPACVTNVSCYGGSNGSATVQVTGGVTPYSYSWSHSGTLHSPTANGLIAGTYYVTVTDANGCTSVANINITQPTAPLAIQNPASILMPSCYGSANGRVNITVSGGTDPYTYVWSTGASTQNLVNITAGNYRVTVTDANGCTIISPTYIVNQPQQVIATVSNIVHTQCNSAVGSVVLTSSDNSSITLNGVTLASGSTFTGLASGYYTAVTNGPCPVSVSFNIHNTNSTLQAVVNVENPDCYGEFGSATVTPTGGTAPYQYVLNGVSEADGIFNNLSIGNYNVQITDAIGCTYHLAFVVSQPQQLNAFVVDVANPSCFGSNNGSIIVNGDGGTYPYDYLWNTGATSTSVNGLSDGLYSVTVTDANGCMTALEIELEQPSILSTPQVVSITQPTCTNPLGSFTISNYNTSYNYVVLPNTGVELNVLNGLITAPAGTYSIYASNGNCMSLPLMVTIQAQPQTPITPIIGSVVQPNCSNPNGTFTIVNYNPSYNYVFIPSTNVVLASNGTVTAPAGTYQVKAINTSLCESGIATVNINTQPATPATPVLSSITQPTCEQPFGQLSILNYSNSLTYQFTPSANVALDVLGNITAPSGTYLLIATNGICSSVETSFVIQANPLTPATPIASAVVQPTCTNAIGSFQITNYNSALIYSITPNTASINGTGLVTGTSGLYYMTASNSSQCISIPLIVEINPQPVIPNTPTISTITHPTCTQPLGSLTITNYQNNLTYQITPNVNVTLDALGHLTAPAGSYTLYATNGVCNSISVSFTINANPNIPATPIVSSIIHPTCSQSLGSFMIQNYSSSLTYNIVPNTSVVISGTGLVTAPAGTYQITAMNAQGCISVAATATINPQPITPAVPVLSSITHPTCTDPYGHFVIQNYINGYNYQFTPSQNVTLDAIGNVSLASGTYQLSVSNGICSSAPISIVINANPAIPQTPSITSVVHPTCQSALGSFVISNYSATLTYNFTPNTGVTLNGSGSVTAPSGTYSIIAQNGSGCVSTAQTVVLNAQPQSVTTPLLSTIVQPTCDVPVAHFAITNFNQSLNYHFTPQTGISMDALGNITASPGSYTLYADNGICSSTTTSFTIQTNPSTPAIPQIGSIIQPTCTQSIGNFTITNYNSGLTYVITPQTGITLNAQGVATASSGTYHIYAMNSSNCISETTTVTINAVPVVPVIPTLTAVVQPTCENQMGYASIMNFNSTYSYMVTPSANVVMDALGHISAPAGTYQVTANNGQCTSNPVTFMVNAQPTTPAVPVVTELVQPTCTNALGSFHISNYNTTLVYTFVPSINVVMTTNGHFTAPAGTYDIRVSNSGCSSDWVSVVIDPQPATPATPIIGTITQPTCDNPNGSFTVLNFNNTYTYSFDPSAGVSMDALGNVTAPTGTYSVEVNNNYCTSNTLTFTINTQPVTPTLMVVGTQNTQCNASIGTVTLRTNMPGVITVNGVSQTVTTTPYEATFNGLAAGYYNATVQSSDNSCSENVGFSITNMNSNLFATVAVTNPLCNGTAGSAVVTTSGGTAPYTYYLNGTLTNNTGTFANLMAGTYQVVVVDQNGCSYAVHFVVTQPTLLVASLGCPSCIEDASCFGSSDGRATVSVSGGTTPYTYSWSHNDTLNCATALHLAAGIYTVTVTDANGCTSITSVTINQPAQALDITSVTPVLNQISCFNENDGSVNITVSGGTLPYQYHWSNGAASEDIFNLPAGSYSVTVTDAHGCQIIGGPFVITEPAGEDLLVLNVSNTYCNSSVGSVTLKATSAGVITLNGVSQNVSAPLFETTFSGLAAGYYNAIFVSTTGCQATESFNVNINNSNLTATVQVTHALCYGSTGSVQVVATGGILPYHNALNGNPSQLEPLFNNLTAGYYNIIVTDAVGCSYSMNFVVAQPNPLTTNLIVSTNETCFGANNGTATIAATGGTAPYSYLWPTTANSQTTASAANLTPGIYVVTVTDAHNCTATQSVSILAAPQTTVYAGADFTICETTASYQIEGATAQNYTSVHWTTSGTGTFSNMFALNPIYYPSSQDISSGTVTLTLTAVTPSPCAPITDQFVLTIVSQATIGLDDQTICTGSTVTLAPLVQHATGYSWITSGDGTFTSTSIMNPVYTPGSLDIAAGSVTLTLTASSTTPCANATENAIITIQPVIISNAGSDQIIYGQTTTTLAANNPAPNTGTWTLVSGPNVPNIINPNSYNTQVTGLTEGAYIFRWTINNLSCGSSSDNVTVTVHTAADLAITKTASTSNPCAGQQVTYTITVTNNGPLAAQNVVVTDQLPAGLTLSSVTPTQGSWTAPLWNIGALANGQTATLTVVTTVNPNVALNTQIVNNASVTTTTLDMVTTNNSAASTITVCTNADLSIVKTVNQNSVQAGNQVTYTLTVTNNGPSVSSGVVVTDNLPTGMTLVSATPSVGTWTSPNWSVGSINPGSSVYMTVVAQTSPALLPGNITNTATVTATTTDPILSNNSSSVGVSITVAADLEVFKTASRNPVTAGDTLTYYITVVNHGGSNATNVVLSDPLPGYLTVITATTSVGTWAPPLWTIGSMTSGSSQTLTMKVRVNSNTPHGTAIVNAASVSSTTPDPNTTNNNTINTIFVETKADLEVIKTADRDTISAGELITYTIQVINHGLSAASNVIVNDQIPTGCTVVSANFTAGSWFIPNWNVGTMQANTQETLTLVILVPSNTDNGATITNTVAVASTTPDPNSENNTSTVDVEIENVADLVANKISIDDVINPGDTITYIISVTNNGPADAYDVVLTEHLPTELEFVSATPSVGTWVMPNLWNIPEIANGETVTLMFKASLSTDVTGNTTVINRVSINSTTPDPDEENNEDDDDIVSSYADLAITKVANIDTVMANDLVVYTITATNNGVTTATNVIITDALPSDLEFVSATGSPQLNLNSVTWVVPELAVGEVVTFNLTAKVKRSATPYTTIANTITITSDLDDSDLSNNSSTASIYVDVLLEPFIPEGFSPNGDGINELFVIRGLENYPDNQLTIFNRWGEIVFEGKPYTNNFDGTSTRGLTVGGNKLPSGTYYYILDLGVKDKEPIKGYFYLAR